MFAWKMAQNEAQFIFGKYVKKLQRGVTPKYVGTNVFISYIGLSK
jgi:hypothetical protein